MENMGHPEIYPIVLTTKTQEIFNCRVDEDFTDEEPYKLIKKQDILADFHNRAAPPEVPEEQEEYKEFKDYSPEDISVYKPPISKPWVSLGSEKEVEEESVKESTKQITYMISRKRSQFGAPIKFSDQNASSIKDAYIECTAYPDKNFTLKVLEKDVGMQVVPHIKDTSTQTKWTYPKNAATQYYPREFSEEEKEILGQSKPLTDFLNNASISCHAYKERDNNAFPEMWEGEARTIKRKRETGTGIVMVLAKNNVEIALQQNEIMNTFVDDWKCLAEEESSFGDKTDTHLKEYQSFTDLHSLTEKMITCVSWHPDIYGLIAVSVAVRLSFEERVHFSGKLLLQPSLILFWSFSDPIHPQLMLESPDDIFCFKFCPTNSNIIAGGCINGQIVMWDITAHAERIENIKTGGSRSKKATLKPMFLLEPDSNKEAMYIRHSAVSSIESGHKKVITDIHWLSDTFEINRMGSVFENRSEICCQLVTCSADCTICFWDIRPQKASTPQPVEKKKEESIEIPLDIPSTFLHLDLSWKPLSKIRLSKGETSLDHCPIKISLSEDHLLHKAQDKVLAQNKVVKAEEMNPYHNLESGLANLLKPIEDFCTKFFVGTEEGEVIYTDWKMERDPDTGRLMAKKPVNLYTVHDGAVHTVQRSPFYNDIILTIGGWNVAIWKEGIMTGPLLQSSCAPRKYTSGHWSLTRPGVFYVGREDGYIDIWDLLEKTHEPAHSQNICITMITYIKPWTFSAKQQFMAVADYYGTLHILEIPWTLSHPSGNEVSSISHYFEREVKHLDYVEQRKKIREQEKKEMELEKEKKKVSQRLLSLTVEEMPSHLLPFCKPRPESSSQANCSKIAPSHPLKTYQKTKEQLEAELKMDYENYLELEKTVLINLGLLKATDTMPFMDVMKETFL
ncbi:WD repeat-containing protein 63 [Pteropus alecto]|uniref:Dynein axonemal intermediate chain 3 n=1 Tax=Pteropus alecto TaxID=9402 RepID=L5K4M6_PTEAL|nr:WD repeat-containing protein 63 [Pteropus alecto]